MRVEIFDRVLDSDDVPVVIFVDEVDHAGEAGGLSGAGRPGDQEEASRPNDQPTNGLGHADLLKGEKLVRDAPENHADESLLLEDGDAEAAIAEGDGEVGTAHFLQFLLAAIRSDRLH